MKSFFYAAVGELLTTYELDVINATLTPTSSISLPAWVQYAWQHPRLPILYVVSSNGGPTGGPGDTHHATTWSINRADGSLSRLGAALTLPARPIHCTVDGLGRQLLVAYNQPSGLSLHALTEEGRLANLKGPDDLKLDGIYGHQIRVTPSNRSAIFVTRGNDARDERKEEPGALRVYGLEGQGLVESQTVQPGDGGLGFGPRHLDFHANGRWVYVSVERQDELQFFSLDASDRLSTKAHTTIRSLAAPANAVGPQLACAVRVHPTGRFVYQANRTDKLADSNGWRVAQGGEDSLVVYSVDPDSGHPALIQRVLVPTVHIRTFSIDLTGRMLIAASIAPVPVERPNGDIQLMPAGLLMYAIGEDGHLSLARQYDIDTRGMLMFWSGLAHV
ncbi:MAG: beta-propeller fold lactonase family protein [Chromatiales bacterium]|nr:beta-propeller fold lactonase family protein [Chromatiales bacterium]